ncbi:polysaccharide deacetylase family protein [Actinoplanes sp. NPDC023801]|uniref:polysaccharide deacetylase family protein n=1 Tax=Actinoplanes sp. NPDC023801 TaxID=3154595 RepID=UPI0033EF2336
MNKPSPAPRDSTSAEAAEVDESAEPTVALSEPVDSGDGEATVTLPAAEISDATVDLASSPGSEPTADLASSPGSEPTAHLTAVSPDADSASDGDESEPTVTLPAAEAADTPAVPADDESEPTTVLYAESEPTTVLSTESEPTTVLSTESEPTTVITAESEPTISLPKPRISPESTVALPVGRESSAEAEPTVAMLIPSPPAPRPAPEPTVTRPSIPAPRSAPTVAPPPSEPTIALPVAPPAPAVVPQRAKPLSRRRLLWAIPAAAGTALLGGTIAALAGRDEPQAAKTPNLVVTEPAPSEIPTPAPAVPQPTTPVMKVPVHTLQDFRKMVPGDPFPTDAIALTIDDGPHPVWTPQILRLLEKHHVPALFCMIGNQVLGHETTARDVAADGHRIANHTWSHPLDLAELPSHAAIKQIHRAQDKIYSTTGITPSLFRSPGGAWSKGLSEAVSQSNVIPMDWTTDPRDWARPGVAHITKRLLAAGPGQILLCHDGGGDRSQTLASLKTVIPALQAKGLKFVALM